MSPFSTNNNLPREMKQAIISDEATRKVIIKEVDYQCGKFELLKEISESSAINIALIGIDTGLIHEPEYTVIYGYLEVIDAIVFRYNELMKSIAVNLLPEDKKLSCVKLGMSTLRELKYGEGVLTKIHDSGLTNYDFYGIIENV